MKKLKRCMAALLSVFVMGTAVLSPLPSQTVQAASECAVSKKGIQGIEFLKNEDAENLGVNNVLLNMYLDQYIVPNTNTGTYSYNYTVDYEYNGKTYKFTDHARQYVETIKTLNKQGVDVTLVLLLRLKPGDWTSATKNIQDLIYAPDSSGEHSVFAWNVYDSAAKDTLSALVEYVMSIYTKDCYVKNWIVGNEVNMPDAYHYTGTADLDTNTGIVAEEFKIVYNAMKKYSDTAKAYICIDHSWTNNDEGKGIGAKYFLDSFNKKVSGLDWNVAFHAYPAIMHSTHENATLWRCKYTPKDENAQFVTGYNLEVLTDYVKKNFGEKCRVILSEQGYDATANEEDQAAAIAYTFYSGQFNDMVDAVIFFSYTDDINDTEFKLGLIKGYSSSNISANKRLAYDVFKYMDKKECKEHVDKYLEVITLDNGKTAADWRQITPLYDPTVFGASPNKEDYESGEIEKDVDDGALTYFDGAKYGMGSYTGDYSAVYNKTYYLKNNRDLQETIGDDEEALLYHFIRYGTVQGRQASAKFSLANYLCNNPDIVSVLQVNSWTDYYLHYIKNGMAENRIAVGTKTIDDLKALTGLPANLDKSTLTGNTGPAEENPDPDPDPDPKPSNSIKVYRLYNSVNQEHLFTTDTNEVRVLVKDFGWNYEGSAWSAPKTGTPVYRLYCAETNAHLFTSDTGERDALLATGGWSIDNNGEPLFYSADAGIAIYRVYNEGIRRHLLTTNKEEYDFLVENGWNGEGVKFFCSALGDPEEALP